MAGALSGLRFSQSACTCLSSCSHNREAHTRERIAPHHVEGGLHACTCTCNLTMSASQMGSSPWSVRSLPAMYQMVSGEAPERMKSAIRCPPWPTPRSGGGEGDQSTQAADRLQTAEKL